MVKWFDKGAKLMKQLQKDVVCNDAARAAGEEMNLMPLDTNTNDNDNDDDSGFNYDNDTVWYLGIYNSDEILPLT